MTLRRNLLARYGLAIISVILGIIIRFSLSQVLQDGVPFALVFCAVIATSWFGGRGPGLLAVALAAFASWYFILPPSLTFSGKHPGSALQILIFILVGFLVALLTGSLRMANDAIQDREAQLRFMAAAMPEILFTADASGKIETFTERFHQYTGKKLSELGSAGWLDLIHSEDRPSLTDSWDDAIARKIEFRSTCRIIGSAGAYRWFQCRAVPMHDKRQRIVRWFGVCADIDDQKRLGEALAQSNEDLQRFAFAASHDLQEPLRMIGIFSDLLVRDYAQNENSQYLAGEIKRGVKRMQDLISACLEYSRISADNANMQSEICLDEPLSDALWGLQAAIEESQAQVIREPLPAVMGDARMLSRVFQNLIANAIKFRGTEPLLVQITARLESDRYVLAIADNGIGMPVNQSVAAFEAFRRFHPKSNYPGSGLGLASVKRIVELHHGRVWAESTPGQGSTFFFTLPLPQNGAMGEKHHGVTSETRD